jgi:hypothetical protein
MPRGLALCVGVSSGQKLPLRFHDRKAASGGLVHLQSEPIKAFGQVPAADAEPGDPAAENRPPDRQLREPVSPHHGVQLPSRQSVFGFGATRSALSHCIRLLAGVGQVM